MVRFSSHMAGTGVSCGVAEFLTGRFLFSLWSSSLVFGVYCWVFLHTSVRLTRGCFPYLPSVSVHHGGVRYVLFIRLPFPLVPHR